MTEEERYNMYWKALTGVLAIFCHEKWDWIDRRLKENSSHHNPYDCLLLAGMIDPQKVMPVMEERFPELRTMDYVQLAVYLETETENHESLMDLIVSFMYNPQEYLNPSE
jgi:hypothetical protein